MAPATVQGAAQPEKSSSKGASKEIKILMLHGYTQSGPLFRAKTRALEKLLAKTLSPFSLLPVLIYPTGPNRLLPSDIPGYEPPAGDDGAPDPDANAPDAWAWFRKHEATGEYRLWDAGMETVAAAVRDAGGVDAVCGFSQGGCVSAAVAAAMEPGREAPTGQAGAWARGLREANGGRGLRFAVLYSGFYAPVDMLRWCYEPKITTPTLHYLGSLDAVVEESRSRALIDCCEDPVVIVHPGGHHVPVAKQWAMPLAGFIKEHASSDEPKAGL